MDMITLIGVIALGVLGATCAALALWCKYADGVVGHVALACVALFAMVVVIDALDGVEMAFLPTSTGVFVAMAAFMLRHAWRAWRFQGRP